MLLELVEAPDSGERYQFFRVKLALCTTEADALGAF